MKTHTCDQVAASRTVPGAISIHSANHSAIHSANHSTDRSRATLSSTPPAGLPSAAMAEESSKQKRIVWVSPRRFAEISGVPISTVYRWVREGKIHHYRAKADGRLWLAPGPAFDVAESPGGISPRRYRDEIGNPLPGLECPRSEMLFGTAAANLLRSYATARVGLTRTADGGFRYVDPVTGDEPLDVYMGAASRVLDNPKKLRTDRHLY